MDSHLRYGFSRFFLNRHFVLSILAVLFGGASAMVVIAFRAAIGGVQLLDSGSRMNTLSAGSLAAPGGRFCLCRRLAGWRLAYSFTGRSRVAAPMASRM